jgi:hypothetical protein
VSAQARLTLPLDAAIEQHAGAPPDIITGLELLAGLPPLWPAGPEAWRLTLTYMRDFAERWDHRARLAGWPDVALYGVHRMAPGANFSALGAAWLAARSAYKVLAIEDNGAILLGTRTASRLHIYRRPPDPEAMLPWLVADRSSPRRS